MDVAAFHEELRRKNRSVFLWSAAVFNTAQLAWVGFDYVFAPEHWHEFLLLRLALFVVNGTIALLVYLGPLRRLTWEAFWLWLIVFASFIAPMPVLVEESFAPYIMGFTLVLFGAGMLPFWPPRWAISSIIAIDLTVPIAIAIGGPVSQDTLVLAGAFVGTATGCAVVMAWYKYDFSKRDFFIRQQLAAAVERETQAHASLGRATGELEAALERLKELDKLKNAFFANVSHELRTPLTLILGPVEDLLSRADDATREPLRVVRRNAERLLRLIDDVLDLARLDARGLRLNLAECDLRAILKTVHENSLPAARVAGLELALEIQPSERRIWGDAHRLEIVLTNLVGNALKYTPSGGAVQLAVRDVDEGVEVEVSDTGQGIAASELPHVFERFYQVKRDDRRSVGVGGVGIGLALAKELTELHGGAIEASSRSGEGSTFRIHIPFGRDHIRPDAIERRRVMATAEAYTRRAGDPPPPSGIYEVPVRPPARDGLAPWQERSRLLVVEDNDELRRFIHELLAADYDVLLAADGDEGWEVARRERPDLVVSDVMMPGRSGAMLCRDIKADPELSATPVILLTARVGSEATLEGYAHGADDFVAKPFHPGVLLARVRVQLRLRAMALQLAQQEKLAAVGNLAAAILHEIRNPINAIHNAARVLNTGTDARRQDALLKVINDGAERILSIASALDAHARPADGDQPSAVDARLGLDATLRLLDYRLDTVSVERSYASDRAAMAAPGPLNQVFLNLLDNAIKAGAQTLRLEVADVGENVRIVVEDDGRGVPRDIAEHMFDAFVSSGAQAGSGLGLYLSRRIVEQYGGRLWHEPGRAGGARFAIELPAMEQVADQGVP
jgi:signal transduction histidine kinase